MLQKAFSVLIPLSAILLLPGCWKQPTHVSHQMIANRDKIPTGFSQNKSFLIIGGEYHVDGNKQKDGLQNRELEKKVKIALEKQGYTLTPLKEENNIADYAIVYKYGISSAKKTAYEPRVVTGSVWSWKNNAFIDTTTYVPVERTYFTKILELFVVELTEYMATRKIPAPIWQSQAWIVDESADMRTNLDFLIVQSTSMFGKDTAGIKSTNMYDNNKSIVWLRSAYMNPDNNFIAK